MDSSEKGRSLNKSIATKVTPYGSRYDGAAFFKGHVRTIKVREAGLVLWQLYFFGPEN